MSPRMVGLFILLFVAMVFGEWYRFLRGFDTSHWTGSNWIVLAFVLIGEAFAAGIIATAVDKALPAVGGRAPSRKRRNARRGTQRYSAR